MKKTKSRTFEQLLIDMVLEKKECTLQSSQVAEPKLVFGTIKDWFEKHESNTNLDTAASNLQFYVQDIHRHIGNKHAVQQNHIHSCRLGLRLECTASIGPVYWHATQETCQVAAKPRELPQWMSSATYSGMIEDNLFARTKVQPMYYLQLFYFSFNQYYLLILVKFLIFKGKVS